MTIPRFDDVRDRQFSSDDELIPFLQSMLEGSFRRQVWVMMLDDEARPLPVLIPMDVQAEPDPDEMVSFADFFSCTALAAGQATLVVTFERPGPMHVVDRDRRWLQLLHDACVYAGFRFRGPFLLVGNTVMSLPVESYESIPMVYSDDDGDHDQGIDGTA